MLWRRWGEGPALVLLHGGSGSWTHWLRNIDALSRDHAVWVPDMPGCGESALPAGAYDADTIYEHVASGIEQCAQGRPVDLVGFSFGALVAGLVAASHPQLIKRLVLVAPPALGIKAPALGLKSLGSRMTPDDHESAVRHNLRSLMLHGAAAIDESAVALHAGNFARDRLRLRRLARTDIMTRLQARWRCPVYAIWGREDALSRHAVDHLSEALKHCDLRAVSVIDAAGHWVQYQQPEAFHRALVSFLRSPDLDAVR